MADYFSQYPYRNIQVTNPLENNPYFQPNVYSYGGPPAPQPAPQQGMGLAGSVGQIANFASDLVEQQSLAAPNAINTSTPGQELDPMGRPIYNLGGTVGEATGINPKDYDTNAGSVIGSVGKGAAAGASVAGVPGAIVGGLISGVGNLIGGRRRRRRAKQRQQSAFRNIRASQLQYNKSMEQNNNQQSVMQDYNNQFNATGRMNNLVNRNNLYGG